MMILLFIFLLLSLILVTRFILKYCTPAYLIWYLKMCLKGSKLFVSGEKLCGDRKDVVVSLTTIPSRIKDIFPCINSILMQTRPPDRIYLNIPNRSKRENKGYQIPCQLRKDKRIILTHCKEDSGPILKLLQTLKEETHPDTLIITVDDDTVYPRHLISTLLRFNEKFPEAALGFRGWRLPASKKFLERTILYANSIKKPYMVDVLSGVSGVLYIRKQFKDDFFSPQGLPDAAFFVDDICISGYLKKNKIEKYLVPYPMREPFSHYINTKNSNPLWRINQDGRNDQDTIDFYFPDE
jgi:hypothetical protein